MGRPVTRTTRVDGGTLELLRLVFGKSTVAYTRLRLEGLVSLDVFRRAWEGKAVREVVVLGIYQGWDSFVDRIVEKQAARKSA